MRVRDLALGELSACLKSAGLRIPCGPFAVELHSNLPAIARGIHELYADFPVLPADSYRDFVVHVAPPNRLRRHWRPQVVFDCDGRQPFKPLPLDQAFAMLEWGLNWILTSHAHHAMLIHAAVVERGGRALILAADPGSGKSTLCAALLHKGWRLLSDELALVSLEDGQLHPIARPVSLKNRSIDIVRSLGPDVVIGEVCHDTAKGSVGHMKPDSASVRALGQPARPGLLVFPKYQSDAELRCEALGPGHALVELVGHTFNFSVLGSSGFESLADLVNAAPAFRIGYGSLAQVIPEIDRLWECWP